MSAYGEDYLGDDLLNVRVCFVCVWLGGEGGEVALLRQAALRCVLWA